MMFKKKNSFLLSVILALICIECKAQCISQPSCEDLGYNQTASDCATDKVIKCPFDTSKVICAGDLTQEVDENPIVADNCATASNRTNLPGRLLFSDGKCSTNSKYEGGEILGVTDMTGNFVFWGGCKNLTYSEAAEFCNSHGGTLAANQHLRSYMQMVNASYKDIEIPFCPQETGRCYRITATSCLLKPNTGLSTYQTVTISATDKIPFYCVKQVGTVL